MSGSFLRNGSKSCIQRLLERRSILIENGVSTGIQTLAKQQQSRTYVRSPLILKKLKDLGFSPSTFSSSLSSSFSSSSSSSSTVSSKNGFVGWYLGMIESRPVLTKSVTSALIYTAADLSSQMITETTSESFDSIRTLRMAGYGLLIMGPSLHFWFNFVSKILPKRDVLTTLKKICMGQTIYGPIMATVFFSLNAALQGENGDEIAARLKRDLLPTLKNGLLYWPMCDFITFKFIPVRLQPLVSNSFAYLWTIYLTYMAGLTKAGGD
ncbi:Mpv17/PMP22 [Macleaya cordata]|uniref:Mpv17/PMP22 n=1 Tax=Macleaya cordata TaxID=56857 RepID=A0A200QFW0_MACCD|nr:Mpv17/PMP22 [Macleaya cordata]